MTEKQTELIVNFINEREERAFKNGDYDVALTLASVKGFIKGVTGYTKGGQAND